MSEAARTKEIQLSIKEQTSHNSITEFRINAPIRNFKVQ